MIIACAGYRVASGGHHQTSFAAMELAIGETAAQYAAYFDTCRRKRNQLDYDVAEIISDTEAKEIIRHVVDFRDLIEAWIKRNHPALGTKST